MIEELTVRSVFVGFVDDFNCLQRNLLDHERWILTSALPYAPQRHKNFISIESGGFNECNPALEPQVGKNLVAGFGESWVLFPSGTLLPSLKCERHTVRDRLSYGEPEYPLARSSRCRRTQKCSEATSASQFRSILLHMPPTAYSSLDQVISVRYKLYDRHYCATEGYYSITNRWHG